MRPLRIAGGLAAIVLAAALTGAGFVAWLIATEAGARLTVARLVDATGSVLTADAVRGSLVDGLVFEGLRFEIERVEATAERATATFDLRALLRGRVVIRDLFVSPVDVEPKPADPEAPDDSGPFEAPLLPVGIVFESVAVAGISVRADSEALEFGQLTMTVSYIGRRVDVSRFESTYQAYSFSTQAQFDLADGPAVDATLSVSGRPGGRDLLFGARVTGTLPTVDVDAELLEPAPLTIAGPVTLNAGPTFDLALAWEALDPALLASFGAPAIPIAAGGGRVSGQPSDIAMTATTAVVADDATIAIDAAVRYTPAMLEVERLRLSREAAVLEVGGGIDLASLDYTFGISGTDLNPDWIMPGWEGRVALTGDASGSLGSDWRVAADGVTVDGVVRGEAFTAAGAGAYGADGELTLARAELRMGRNTLTAVGRIGSALNLDVQADLVDLGGLMDGLGGSLTGTVTASGTLQVPVLDGELELADFAYSGVRVAALDVSGQVGLSGTTAVDLAVAATGVAVGEVPPVTIAGDVTGTAAAHAADVTIGADGWTGDARFSGSLSEFTAWAGRIEALRYARPPFGEWALREPAALAASTSRVELQTACLGQGDAELCLGFVYGAAEAGRLQVRATDVDLGVLQPLLPESVTASGRYAVDIDIAGPRSNPLGTLRIDGGPTRLSYARSAQETVSAEFRRVTAEARIDSDSFTSSAAVLGTGTDNLSFDLTGDRQADDSVAIDGALEVIWADIAPLAVLSRHVSGAAGNVAAAVRIGGTLDTPQVDGRAVLSNGRLDLPEWGVVAESISGTAVSENGEVVAFEATGRIDGSELRLTGTTELAAAAGWPTRLMLSGERVPLVQVADADIVVSPALTIDVDLPRVNVAGTVDVPEALISIAELPEQAVRPSSDSVVHGGETAEPTSPLLLTADIDLRLGDDVRYEGSGLLADLDGALRLRYTSEASADASGTLSVGGTYEAFGQELMLERGELVFTGPLDNPTLNVRAVRRVDAVTVGINLTGTLEAPVSRMFSEPAMAEADAVSYLLFGRPLAVPDGADDPDQLRNAAVSLGLRQAVPVIQRIGDSLGFDEFAIESTDVDAGELMAGKFLSPKLYVRYSYGLFNRIGGLLLQYRINERVSIETRSGGQKSMDILYTIERD